MRNLPNRPHAARLTAGPIVTPLAITAIDRKFKTIDCFIVLDVDELSRTTHKRFFG